MKLQRTALCLGCDELIELAPDQPNQCPSCTSEHLVPLAKWLDRVDSSDHLAMALERNRGERA